YSPIIRTLRLTSFAEIVEAVLHSVVRRSGIASAAAHRARRVASRAASADDRRARRRVSRRSRHRASSDGHPRRRRADRASSRPRNVRRSRARRYAALAARDVARRALDDVRRQRSQAPHDRRYDRRAAARPERRDPGCALPLHAPRAQPRRDAVRAHRHLPRGRRIPPRPEAFPERDRHPVAALPSRRRDRARVAAAAHRRGGRRDGAPSRDPGELAGRRGAARVLRPGRTRDLLRRGDLPRRLHPPRDRPVAVSAIAEVRSYAFRAPVQHPVRTSFGTMRERPMVLVRVAPDDGAFGWGEIWCNYPSCAAEHRARLLVELVAPLLLGRSPDDPAATWNELTQRTAVLAIQCGEPGPIAQTLAGVEIALWDLLARRAGAPLWRFLGGDGDEIGVYASGLNPDEPERQAERALETGFRAVKLKVGFGIERDVRNARALRALCGRDVAVMVDANQAWDVDTAIRAACALDECALAWLEEPLRADRPSSDWRAIADATAIPLAAGENITSAEAFVAAYTDGAVAVVQPDVAKWGGLGACRTIAR